MSVQLLQGDCLELMKQLPSGSVNAIICDLPYGTTACAWDTVIPFEPLWSEYKRLVKKGGAIVLFGSQPFTALLVASNLKWFRHELIWEKDKATGHLQVAIKPMRKHENILVFGNGGVTYNPQMSKKPSWKIRAIRSRESGTPLYGEFADTKPMQAIDVSCPMSIYPCAVTSGEERGFHPTQKPVALLEYLIRTYTNEGETVLDNCMGSGSTGVACANTNRNFIGMELREDYFNIARNRIENTQPLLQAVPA